MLVMAMEVMMAEDTNRINNTVVCNPVVFRLLLEECFGRHNVTQILGSYFVREPKKGWALYG